MTCKGVRRTLPEKKKKKLKEENESYVKKNKKHLPVHLPVLVINVFAYYIITGLLLMLKEKKRKRLHAVDMVIMCIELMILVCIEKKFTLQDQH